MTKDAAALALRDQIFTMLCTSDPNHTSLPIFIALDTESHKDRIVELGISTFDPYNHTLLGESRKSEVGTANRYHYRPFHLGIPQPFQNTDLRCLLEMHLAPRDGNGQLRSVVLVGHRISTDIAVLERHSGLNIATLPNVQAVLDTQNIAQVVLYKPHPPGLKTILRELELEYIGLRNAGHGSRYTLRVMLLMFARFKRLSGVDQFGDMMRVVWLVEEVARFHKVREGRKWCESKRVKNTGIVDILDQDAYEDERGDCGMLFLLDE